MKLISYIIRNLTFRIWKISFISKIEINIWKKAKMKMMRDHYSYSIIKIKSIKMQLKIKKKEPFWNYFIKINHLIINNKINEH